VYAVTAGRRRGLLDNPEAAIVISSSGMMTGGPAPLYARAFAADEKSAIVFSGYQDDESPGAALLRARQGTTVALGKEELTLSCAVERYSLSAHADAAPGRARRSWCTGSRTRYVPWPSVSPAITPRSR